MLILKKIYIFFIIEKKSTLFQRLFDDPSVKLKVN